MDELKKIYRENLIRKYAIVLLLIISSVIGVGVLTNSSFYSMIYATLSFVLVAAGLANFLRRKQTLLNEVNYFDITEKHYIINWFF